MIEFTPNELEAQKWSYMYAYNLKLGSVYKEDGREFVIVDILNHDGIIEFLAYDRKYRRLVPRFRDQHSQILVKD